ncbi:GNAT family N-acetyltransferase [Candidatus Woesearchaeota archaeon]|nr:GNAT family N-acetyltransferase [Candidatus Woesearchaeota archaeon]
MKLKKEVIMSKGLKISLLEKEKVIGRGYLYIMKNELHKQPSLIGYLEDIYVGEKYRQKGYGKKIIQTLIEEARKQSCYKVILTSRYGREKLHRWYEKFGFKDHGKEFRMDL